jgi:hypothetical protein
VEVIKSSELKISVSYDLVFANDRKALLNLCFRDAFLIIRKVPIIISFLRLYRKNAILRRKLNV